MKATEVSQEVDNAATEPSGEVYAAIAMAIYEATELRDEDHTSLTSQNTVWNYSPWSSKFHTMRELPNKK